MAMYWSRCSSILSWSWYWKVRAIVIFRHRLKLLQLAEEDQRQYKLQQELAKNRQSNLDQLSKSMENKKQQSTMDIDPFLAFQQSIQYQKEQQAKIEAQQ